MLQVKQWKIAHGTFDKMNQRALAPDRYTYSTLITHFGKAGMFDSVSLQILSKDIYITLSKPIICCTL